MKDDRLSMIDSVLHLLCSFYLHFSFWGLITRLSYSDFIKWEYAHYFRQIGTEEL